MFKVGDLVKMNPDFVEWCKEEYSRTQNPSLDLWAKWGPEFLEIVEAEINFVDPKYTDIRVRPEHSGHSGLIVSVGNINMKLFGTEMVPFSLANGTQYSNDDDDRCKKCGAPGKVTGMACVCSKCGQIIWGI